MFVAPELHLELRYIAGRQQFLTLALPAKGAFRPSLSSQTLKQQPGDYSLLPVDQVRG